MSNKWNDRMLAVVIVGSLLCSIVSLWHKAGFSAPPLISIPLQHAVGKKIMEQKPDPVKEPQSQKLVSQNLDTAHHGNSLLWDTTSVRTAAAASNRKAQVENTLALLQASPWNLTETAKLLSSEDGKIRESAGAYLVSVGNAEAIAQLLDAIKSEQELDVRENLIESLRHVTNPAAIPVLARHAQDLSDLELHRVCRNAMSAMTDSAAAAQLIEILQQGGNEYALEPIAYAISHIRHTNAISVLIQGALSDSERVAMACIQGLGYLNTRESFDALLTLEKQLAGTERGQIAALVANQFALPNK